MTSRTIFCDDENGNATTQRCAETAPAPVEMAERIAALPVGIDTRSEWTWFRLANGDLVLGFFPCGDTYFETEADDNRP